MNDRINITTEQAASLLEQAIEKLEVMTAEVAQLKAERDELRDENERLQFRLTELKDANNWNAERLTLEREIAGVLREELEKLEWVTCVKCLARKTCQYAFDPYNTNGDCLAEK